MHSRFCGGKDRAIHGSKREGQRVGKLSVIQAGKAEFYIHAPVQINDFLLGTTLSAPSTTTA